MIDTQAIAKLFGLENRVAVVTGAATGIGHQIARTYHQAGARIVAADVNTGPNEALVAELNQRSGGTAVAVHADMGEPKSIKNLFAQTVTAFGGLDILVNCAAIDPIRPFEDVDVQLWDQVVNVDLRGVFFATQEAVVLMKKQGRGGSIVNISSINSLLAVIFDHVHYAAVKAGVNGITVSTALEYAGDKIRVNAILPGAIATERAIKLQATQTLRGPMMQPGRIPLGNTAGTPHDIAHACLFLASDASSYITGQLLAVDGGFMVS